MSLKTYKKKRRFNETNEPIGECGKRASGHSFVIHKHHARRLHYDLRLEMNGVLKSWAVPKGPSLDPQVKRLAVEVEDHPLAYGDFEGTIPKGQYGAGEVIIWDSGTWECEGSAIKSWQQGKIKFWLHGKKCRGAWELIRTKSKPDQKQPSWLLMKINDEFADQKRDITLSEPDSVNRKKPPEKWQKMPLFKPQLATLVKNLPTGDEWLQEIKFDGYRIICQLQNQQTKFFSRNHEERTHRFPAIASEIESLKAKSAVFDGEVVVMDKNGRSHFQRLQNALRENDCQIIEYYVFDLLYLDGKDLRELPLIKRKERLKKLLAKTPSLKHVHFTEKEGTSITWVKPIHVAQIQFSNWTDDGLLRQPVFKGLRSDKKSREVKQETSAIESIVITHPDRVMYPDVGLTKWDIAQYFLNVADYILPFVQQRPLSLLRCPGGKNCFFQKHLNDTKTKAIRSAQINRKGEKDNVILIDDVAGLIELVQWGAMEIHPWNASYPAIDSPDQIIFDLDPDPSVAWKEVIAAAIFIRDVLLDLKIETYVKTTGGKGLHLHIPLAKKYSWQQVHDFAQIFAQQVAEQFPKKFTASPLKVKRKGKIFIDYMRNNPGSTAIAPYATRQGKLAAVATPVSFAGLKKLKSSAQFTVKNLMQRLKRLKKDPWDDFFRNPQKLPTLKK